MEKYDTIGKGWYFRFDDNSKLSYELVIISNCMDSWVDFWVGIQSAGDLVSETSKVRILHSAEEDKLFPGVVSFRFEITSLCETYQNQTTKIQLMISVNNLMTSLIQFFISRFQFLLSLNVRDISNSRINVTLAFHKIRHMFRKWSGGVEKNPNPGSRCAPATQMADVWCRPAL